MATDRIYRNPERVVFLVWLMIVGSVASYAFYTHATCPECMPAPVVADCP